MCNSQLTEGWYRFVGAASSLFKPIETRNTKHRTWVSDFRAMYCDNQLAGGWYRFVGAAAARMPTTRVPAYRCGADLSGWFMTAHHKVEDG